MPRTSANAMLEARVRNLEARTGKTLEQWIEVVRKSKLDKSREISTFLKDKHRLGGATAALIFQTFKGGGAAWEENADALVDALFAKHAAQRPIYEALVKAVRGFGPDVRVEPRRTYVTLASRSMFGLVRPGAGRLDVGLILPGIAPTARLHIAKSLGSDRITHRIALRQLKDIDAEALRWIARARAAKQ